MPPSDKLIHGSPADWLARAKGDLVMARITLPEGGYYEDLCYHAQQAAEKAIKAVYMLHKMAFRYTHDLDALLSGLAQGGIAIPQEVKQSVALTLFAWETRYPGFEKAISADDYQVALRQAENVFQWAEQVLGQGASAPEAAERNQEST